jgi:hypothetical protein
MRALLVIDFKGKEPLNVLSFDVSAKSSQNDNVLMTEERKPPTAPTVIAPGSHLEIPLVSEREATSVEGWKWEVSLRVKLVKPGGVHEGHFDYCVPGAETPIWYCRPMAAFTVQ